MSFDADDFEHDRGLLPPNQANKAIQTDRWLSVNPNTNFTPPFMDHYSPSLHDGRSESSSLFDGQGSPMTGLLERLMSLVHRMSQADALTLTKRLKRQNLRGADVKHLSRTTVGNILSELTQLRAQYRVFLEDERMTLLCTRRDLRGLFKVFKEAFEEMSQMRVTLNDVILEPSIAGKLSELALDPVKAEAMERERKSAGSLLGASWMAPFSKLFGTTLHDLSHLTTSPSRHLDRDRGELRHPRPVPKIAPALAASTTTVNVEFSGAGAGKSVTNVFSTPASGDGIGAKDPSLGLNTQKSAVTSSNVRNVMGIFAGAPRPEDISDPWVVLPRIPRRVQSTYFRCDPSDGSPATMGKYVSRKRHMPQMSRDVDAVLDAEIICRNDLRGSDGPVPLPPDRPIHRRGLSDSSIHSTFIAQEEAGPCTQRMPPLEHPSVLQTLSKTVRSFKQVASHTISGVVHGTTVSSASSPSTTSSAPEGKASRESTDVSRPIPQRSTTPFSSLLPSLVTFGAVSSLEPGFTQSSLFGSSFREEPAIHRHLGRESQGRDI
ncbi:hypothetical protein ID866_2595 [Astraeus odoratus]|nr:hypothetical protein ID866_2595 [Astraeus odoratus]